MRACGRAREVAVETNVLDAADVVGRVDEDADINRLPLHARNIVSVR